MEKTLKSKVRHAKILGTKVMIKEITASFQLSTMIDSLYLIKI